MLQLQDVHISYGRIAAVQGISLSVNAGEFVGLVGHNGAGKTTTLHAVTGLVRPTKGAINFEGRSLIGQKPEAILRRGVALVPENRHIFTRLTVGENLRIGASIRSRDSQLSEDMDRVLTLFPVLRAHHSRLAGKLSGGEQQQLAIGRALLSRPRLLLLDEPSLGLAPQLVELVFEILKTLHDDGVTILLVEQNVSQTIKAADRTYVIRSGGKVVVEGSAAELEAMPDFAATYLGFRKSENGA